MTDKQEIPELVFQGIGASPGLAHGPAFVFFQKEMEVPIYGISESKLNSETKRFEDALIKTRKQIMKIRTRVAETLGEAEAQIFDAHMLVLEDKALIDETIKELKDTCYNIDYCFHVVSQRYIDAFDKIDDEYIKERATDIKDVSKRVLANLLGQNETSLLRFNDKKIIISEDLSPSDTAEIDKSCILAILTNKGSRTSHSVIMARSLQIPAVVGLHNITQQVNNEDYVIVDGYDGVVILNPSQETLSRYGQIKREKDSVQKVFESVNSLPAETKDGSSIDLMVNIEGNWDLERIQAIGATGIGLFRTESLFLGADKAPDEEAQYEVYSRIIESMAPFPVTIRTLDLGGDKRMNTAFSHDDEANPFMGFRAIRLCLEHKDLFKDQLRAILRASAHGKAKIMYPMITSPSELIQANEVLQEAKNELEERKQDFDHSIEIGSMIETPSAALTADLLAKHCSFFSIGTNDLIQYMLAVDRVNDRIAHLYQPHHPSVIRMLKLIIDSAHKNNVKVSVCGEMAADPMYAALLIGMGVDTLSTATNALPEIKYLIRAMNFKDAQKMAKKLVKEDDPFFILKTLREFYLAHVGDVLS